jgi:hypothetical protein
MDYKTNILLIRLKQFKLLFPLVLIFLQSQAFSQNLDVEFWKNKYDSSLVLHKAYILELSNSKTSDNLYYLAYGLDGATAMFEATGDSQYLDFAFLLIENALNNAEPTCNFAPKTYPCGYFGWPAFPDKDAQHALYESFLFRYVTRFLTVIHNDSNIMSDELYRRKYNEIVLFTEKNIWEKWHTRGLENIYRSRTFLAAHWAFIALNLHQIGSSKSAECLMVMEDFHFAGFPEHPGSKLNGAALNKQIQHDKINKRHFSWVNDTWDRLPDSKKLVQDVSHANGLVAYLINAYLYGSYFNYTDVLGLKELFWEVVWHDTPESPAPQDCFNFEKPCQNLTIGIGKFQADGWVKLGRIFPDIQHFYENPKNLNVITEYLPHLSYNAFAHLAFNAKLLNESGQLNK